MKEFLLFMAKLAGVVLLAGTPSGCSMTRASVVAYVSANRPRRFRSTHLRIVISR